MNSTHKAAIEGLLLGFGGLIFLVGLWHVGGFILSAFGKAIGCSA